MELRRSTSNGNLTKIRIRCNRAHQIYNYPHRSGRNYLFYKTPTPDIGGCKLIDTELMPHSCVRYISY